MPIHTQQKHAAVYEKAINACKVAIQNKDDTSEKDVETLKKAVEDAKAGLVYNPTNQEMASIQLKKQMPLSHLSQIRKRYIHRTTESIWC